MSQILIVEDHEKIRANMTFQLKDAGYKVQGLKSAEEAEQRLLDKTRALPDLMLLDIRMGGKSGVDLIRDLDEDRMPPTIVVSGEATISETVEALRLGVYDFIEKPVSKARLLRSVTNCLEHGALKRQIRELKNRLQGGPLLLGESKPMQELKQLIAKVAPTNGRILIRGESGSGKELIASLIHQGSKRNKGPFIKINCAAIPANLIEDELFGHVRGAFTDARTDKQGLFELAHGGSLFLDEIGDMDIGLQARLLRVLEDGQIRRIGDSRDRKVDVRVITATHADLETLVAQNRFREDLYFRIGAIPITAPPLRERGPDLPMLITWFVTEFCRSNQIRQKQIEPDVFKTLQDYHWPGNVRELRNLCERLVILGGDPISVEHLPSGIFHSQPKLEAGLLPIPFSTRTLPLREFKTWCEKEYIEQVLRRTDWNFTKASQLLDIQRTYLYQKVNSLGIKTPSRP